MKQLFSVIDLGQALDLQVATAQEREYPHSCDSSTIPVQAHLASCGFLVAADVLGIYKLRHMSGVWPLAVWHYNYSANDR